MSFVSYGSFVSIASSAVRHLALLALLLTFVGNAPAAPPSVPNAPAATAPPTSAPADVDSLLDALDRRGKELKDFSATVKLKTIDLISGDDNTQNGTVYFQSDADRGGKVRVNFASKTSSDGITQKKPIDYVLVNEWLWERDYSKKTQIKHQVLKPGEKANLLKLGEGAFPLPIGQDKADVHREFIVTQLKVAKDDPADTVHLSLVPRPDQPSARRLAKLDIWIETKTSMPVRIDTLAPNKESVQSTSLTDLKINTGLPPDTFALPELPPGWSTQTESLQP